MVDAVAVLPPGFRVTDNSTGAPVSGAKLKFYAAGTSTPRTVYSTSDLSTTSLGATVYCDSMGTPVASQGSNTAVMIYTGTTAYKLVITDSNDTTIRSLDNIKGALDTSTFLTTGSTSTLTQPVITKTANYTIVAADRSKLIEANTTGGQFTLTLTAAATLGDNWSVKVRNSGTANQFILAASQAIAFEGQTFTARAFQIGEGCEIICDGTGFKIVGHQAPLMASRDPGAIRIADRVTADPGSPTAGARYIVQTGYGSYATGDIIEANGASFNKYTPPTDCGWIAYVQDEDRFYSFKGSAWVDILNPLRVADFPSGTVIGRAYTEYTANTNLATSIPADDTIPQNTEGTEILSVALTLTNAANRVRARFSGFFSVATDGVVTAALFIGSSADAINAVGFDSANAGASGVDRLKPLPLDFEHAPGSVGPHTYSIRVGGAAVTIRMNGTSAARRYGGAARSVLILEEIVP